MDEVGEFFKATNENQPPRIPTEEKDLIELRRQTTQLIIKVVLPREPTKTANTGHFWSIFLSFFFFFFFFFYFFFFFFLFFFLLFFLPWSHSSNCQVLVRAHGASCLEDGPRSLWPRAQQVADSGKLFP